MSAVSKVDVVVVPVSELIPIVVVAISVTVPMALKLSVCGATGGSGLNIESALETPQMTAEAVMMTAKVRKASVFHDLFWRTIFSTICIWGSTFLRRSKKFLRLI